MYKALADIHPELADCKIFEGFGHAEFTYLGHYLIIETVLQIIAPISHRFSDISVASIDEAISRSHITS